MTASSTRMRQIMDVSSAIWGGIIAGTAFLLVQMAMAVWVLGSSPWVVFRWLAAIVLGEGVLPPPAGFNLLIFMIGLVIHYATSIGAALLLAFIIHRWGLIVGIVGGALFGLALYAVNYYTLTFFFPWFFLIRNWAMVVGHIMFGALAGGIYEALEVEEFEPIED
ncbi:MAG: hypothetical protein DWQ04_01300 [Chloroflexi bacterium]|nr:MAG: hypothetical protein DWQ04_01300 [Chloroflexota bacterium]